MLERKKTLNVFKDAKHAFGSYDDFPVGPPGTDPMPHLSRNRCDQPFFLIAERDQVLVQMAGRATLRFQGAPAVALAPGDTVYLPARMPSRIFPDGECVQLRLKAEPGGKEAIAWYCEPCGTLLHAIEIAPGVVQAAYLAGVHAFNASPRRCQDCGLEHPRVELGDIAWDAVATALCTPAG